MRGGVSGRLLKEGWAEERGEENGRKGKTYRKGEGGMVNRKKKGGGRSG